MKCVVVSHKECWESDTSETGYATDGGFAFQMRALSQLFDSTALLLPYSPAGKRSGEVPITGRNVSVIPLKRPTGAGLRRKLGLPFWFLRNGPTLLREILKANAVHALIPGDVGTIGMILALALRKPLLVRHCGNWFVQETSAEHFWKWFMEHFAGGKNVMLATGGAPEPPSRRNSAIQWMFSTTLTREELTISSPTGDSPRRARSRLIIVCRQEKRKGTSSVIRSLPLIRTFLPSVTFDVVGTGTEMERLRELTQDLRLTQQVTFHGQVRHSRVLQLLRQSDLFCYPTTSSEGFPKAVLEALAMGLPVITTRVSVLPQLLKTGCGLLMDSTEPGAIAGAVREILLDSARYSAMSKRAVQTARAYSLEDWRDRIAALLQSAWGPLSSHA